MRITITVANVRELISRMRGAPEVIQEEMIRGVNRGTQEGEQRSKRLVGKKTRHLMRSITRTPAVFAGGTVTGAWGTNVPYARAHEEGTEPHVIQAKNRRALRFTIGDRVLFRRKVNHPGTTGRFFMRDAKTWLEPQMAQEFRAVVIRIINRLGG